MSVIFYLSLPVSTNKIVFIPKGSIKGIVSYLNNKGYDLNSFDGFFLRFIGRPQNGFLNISDKTITKADLLYEISHSKAALKNVTLIPGETLYFFNEILAKEFFVDSLELQKAYDLYASYEDGVILADTYSLPIGASAKFLIQYLVDISMQRHKDLAIELLGRYEQEEWFRYIRIASIVQKEAANLDEMPIISAVIFNRLKKRMPLQMDGSLNYGKFSHSKVTPQRIKTDDSDYNTYKREGIPKNPVGSVSLSAIKAAVYPAKVDYLFFVRNSHGTHTFSNTFQEHRMNIKKGSSR